MAALEHQPLQGAARVWGTLALSGATFMNVLDTSIANVSLPAIAGDLGVSPNQGTWVITSFAVANAIAVPLTGWLSQRFGQVRLFVASVVLFVIASWLCGLAPNMTVLIALHDLNLAARYADRVALIVAGEIKALGTPKEVLRPELISQVYQWPVQVIQHPFLDTPLILPDIK